MPIPSSIDHKTPLKLHVIQNYNCSEIHWLVFLFRSDNWCVFMACEIWNKMYKNEFTSYSVQRLFTIISSLYQYLYYIQVMKAFTLDSKTFLEEDKGIPTSYTQWCITVTSQRARWCLKSPVFWLFTQPFVQAQIKENFKVPRHWYLWGEFTGDRWLPAQRASNAENVSVWWRHHGSVVIFTMLGIYCRLHL